jgi:tripartite ATP-independent transporter DctP family solute receptor
MRKVSQFLVLLLTVVVGMALTQCQAAYKYTKATLKIAHIYSADHSSHKGALKLAELLKKKTNGAVKLEIYPNSQLGSEKDIFDMVVAGNVDMIITGSGLMAKRYAPAAIIDTGFIAKDRDHLLRILKSPAFKEISDGALKTTGVRTLGAFYFGTRHVTCNKMIKTPDDMKNMKLRVPENPTVMAAVKAMGAIPTPIALSEVYVALSQGVIDGQENPAAMIATQKFYEVQKYLILTNHLVQPNFFFISEKSWVKLSPQTQKVFTKCAKEAADYANKVAFAEEDNCFNFLKKKGMHIVKVNKNLFAETASKTLNADLIKRLGDDKLLKKITAIK